MRYPTLLTLGLLLLTASYSFAEERLEESKDFKWRKGNLHTHSLWSDGDDYLESIGLWYRNQGYDFLCYTDHNVLANTVRWIDVEKSKGKMVAYNRLKKLFPNDWVEERTKNDRLEVRLKTFEEVSKKLAIPDKYLLIQGEEISDKFEKSHIHMNASNLEKKIAPTTGSSVKEKIQNHVDEVMRQRKETGKSILIHLNHPNFHYSITAEDLMSVYGENFFEVFNAHPSVHNHGDHQHASTEDIWDIILSMRIAKLDMPLMYGIGTDDGHSYLKIGESQEKRRRAEPGRAWVMVLTKKLEPNSIVKQMEAGRFYASSGVSMKSITQSEKGLKVDVQPEDGVTYKIDFIGTRKNFDSSSKPVKDKDGKEVRATRIYSDDVGTVFSSTKGSKAFYKFQGDELYVRAVITSSKEHPNPSEKGEYEKAWIQPIHGPGAPEKK